MNITKRWLNKKIIGLTVMLFSSVCAEAQTSALAGTGARFDSSAVWHPPAGFREMLDKPCDSLTSSALQNRLIALMRELGATSEAVRFTVLTDTTGYLRHFVDAGIVGVAYVAYPLRANENFGITLVNGRPEMIDVDDFQFVNLTELKKDSTYLKIVDAFPDASVWPGDRFHFDQARCTQLPGGGQRFVLTYVIRNGCHACEHIGIAHFAFDFDKDGNFTGTRLLGVTSLVP